MPDNLPKSGYTPENYKALVDSTKLANRAFYEQFNIPKQTFYKHFNGDRTMKWQDWEALLKKVEKFNRGESHDN